MKQIEDEYVLGMMEARYLPEKGTGSFGQAVESAKIGELACRAVWEGEQFIFIHETSEELPRKVGDWMEVNQMYTIKSDETTTGNLVCHKGLDNKIHTGWTPTNEDMLAEDWQIFYVYPF